MREIKFKVWLPYAKIMMQPRDIQTIYESVINGVTIGQLKSWVYLQYTGMKDRQGNEIYEGDILKVMEEFDTERWAIVKWGGYYPAFTLSPVIEDEEYNSLQYACCEASCRVVGNIYENTELVNNEQEAQGSDTTKMPKDQKPD